MPALIKPVLAVAAAAALGVRVGISPHTHRAGTSDAEARQMRHVTVLLGREVAAAARCDPAAAPVRFQPRVVPALRHAGLRLALAAVLIPGFARRWLQRLDEGA